MDTVTPNGSGFAREVIASGLDRPISFAQASDGRIFVAEQDGVVKIIDGSNVIATALDISDVVNSFRDRGLLGITLDPDFENNGHIYLQYTVDLDPSNPDAEDFSSEAAGELVRYTIDPNNPNAIDPTSKIVILDGHEMSDATHSVGDLDFDNDGNLIFTWGDGGFDTDLLNSVQDVNSVQGKLFRIDPDTFEGVPDNPFYDSSDPGSVASKVLAVGIRNSWKLSVDRETGDIYMGEVTDDGPEEINVVRADGSSIPNFGWPYFQGNDRTDFGTLPDNFEYEQPFITLPHLSTTGAGDAIFGGLYYTGDAYDPIYQGRYFFGNTSQGNFYTSDSEGNYIQFGESGLFQWTVDLQNGPDGDLIGLRLFNDNFSGGELYRLVSDNQSGNNAPQVVALATQTADDETFTATLDASNSTDPDGDSLTYLWDFDSDGIFDAQGAVVNATYSQPGKTVTTVRVEDGNGNVVDQQLEFTVGPDASTGNNLAFGRPTIQSGTNGDAIASRAVDGNTDGTLENGSVSETTVTRSPLWQVDLGAQRSIGEIEIFPHTGDGTALDDFFVLISPNEFTSNNLAAARSDPGVVEYRVTDPLDGPLSIPLEAEGRYVRIQLESLEASLSLAEVRVLEAETGGETRFNDDPEQTQYLFGESSQDVFVIDGSKDDYSVSKTQSGNGHVVYSGDSVDLLFDFETVEFNDGSVQLTEPITEFFDRPSEVQYLFGTDEEETFVIDGPSSNYNWAPTQDGGGYVVWGNGSHDLLYDIENVRFSDTTIVLETGEPPEPGNIVNDIPETTQYLTGIGDNDTFRVNGNSGDYSWSKTLDETGIVIWNPERHDILTGFENIQFNNETIDLTAPQPLRIEDDPDRTQFVFGTEERETFVIDGNSSDYNWGETQDGTGYVVYNESGHDILYDIEELEFQNQVVELDPIVA